jgi:hypothetical protein
MRWISSACAGLIMAMSLDPTITFTGAMITQTMQLPPPAPVPIPALTSPVSGSHFSKSRTEKEAE